MTLRNSGCEEVKCDNTDPHHGGDRHGWAAWREKVVRERTVTQGIVAQRVVTERILKQSLVTERVYKQRQA